MHLEKVKMAEVEELGAYTPAQQGVTVNWRKRAVVGTIVRSKYSWAVALTLSLCKEIHDFRNVAHEAAEVEGAIELMEVLAL